MAKLVFEKLDLVPVFRLLNILFFGCQVPNTYTFMILLEKIIQINQEVLFFQWHNQLNAADMSLVPRILIVCLKHYVSINTHSVPFGYRN